MLLCVEKENATGPCTHHVHAIVHFKTNVPKSTFQMWVDRFLGKHYTKDEGVVKHDYNRRAAIDVRTCYCIKDEYLSKHDTSTHYVGLDEFDVDAATADLPNQEQQESLQTTKSDRVINAVWMAYSAKWAEFAPHDDSIESAYTWYNHATNGDLIECMSDPRKQTQFVEQLQRYRSKRNDFTGAQIASMKRIEEAYFHDANEEENVLKRPRKKAKNAAQGEIRSEEV